MDVICQYSLTVRIHTVQISVVSFHFNHVGLFVFFICLQSWQRTNIGFVLFGSFVIAFTAPRQLQFSYPVEEQREGDGEERFRQHTIQREEGRKGS